MDDFILSHISKFSYPDQLLLLLQSYGGMVLKYAQDRNGNLRLSFITSFRSKVLL
jgi:hypothetical protein